MPGIDRGIDVDLTLETGSIHRRCILAGKDLANRNMDLEFGGKMVRASDILRLSLALLYENELKIP